MLGEERFDWRATPRLCDVGWCFAATLLRPRTILKMLELSTQLAFVSIPNRSLPSFLKENKNGSIYWLSSTLFAPSAMRFTSSCPFLTTSSIVFFAFWISSGLTSRLVLYFPISLLCSCRARWMPASAFSAAFRASSMASRRVSPVGGGRGTWMVRGLACSGASGTN